MAKNLFPILIAGGALAFLATRKKKKAKKAEKPIVITYAPEELSGQTINLKTGSTFDIVALAGENWTITTDLPVEELATEAGEQVLRVTGASAGSFPSTLYPPAGSDKTAAAFTVKVA